MTVPSPQLLKFPCDFPIKIMGLATNDFESRVVAIVGKYVDELGVGAVTKRSSRGGKYISVTVAIEAKSQLQLDGIYRELSADERILMVL